LFIGEILISNKQKSYVLKRYNKGEGVGC